MKLSNKYHKIQTIFKRDFENKGQIIEGEWVNDEIKYLKDNDWVWTEKVDGTNIRIVYKAQDSNESRDIDIIKTVDFAGRSDEAQLPPFLLKYLQETFTADKLAKIFPYEYDPDMGYEPLEVVLYGEGYGHKIGKMGSKYKADGNSFVLFDVRINQWWLERHNVEDIAKKLGIEVVPVIGHGTLKEALEKVRKGFNSKWGEFPAEGIVARPRFDLFTRSGERIIAKIKHKDFKKR